MVERITAHPLLHDERLVSLGLAYATAGVDIHAWARDRGGGAPSARKNGRRVSFNDKSLVSVREIEAREEPPEPGDKGDTEGDVEGPAQRAQPLRRRPHRCIARRLGARGRDEAPREGVRAAATEGQGGGGRSRGARQGAERRASYY